MSEAGMFDTSEPSPMSIATKAASATDAPRATAVEGMTGRMAPSAAPNSSVGP